MKKHFSTYILVLTFIIGLSLLLYPTISNYWNSLHQSHAIIDYDATLSKMKEEDYGPLLEAAENYNQQIRALEFPLTNYVSVDGYEETLKAVGNGVMGYISIPKIDAEIPFYHGTSDGVLSNAVGHLEGSTLPIGGESTHCVLSAHRGLPSAKLFTELDRLVVGDTFSLSVLNMKLTYEVDQILIVEPTQVDDLAIIEGEDYCTLVTCTPYGVNTHRMLVRGKRIDNLEEKVTRVTADAIQIEPLIVAPIVAIPILLLLLFALLFKDGRARKKGR